MRSPPLLTLLLLMADHTADKGADGEEHHEHEQHVGEERRVEVAVLVERPVVADEPEQGEDDDDEAHKHV